VATFDVPVGKAFSVVFDGSPDSHEHDVLIDETDRTTTYRVTGIAHSILPLRAPTSATRKATRALESMAITDRAECKNRTTQDADPSNQRGRSV